MNADFYKRIMHPFQVHPQSVSILNLTNKLLTLAGFISYPALLVLTAICFDKRFFAFLFVPAFFFLSMSKIRKIMNRPRPYEKYNIQPLIPHNGTGQSFPSRHVFSIFMIGSLWYGYFRPIGIFLLICGVLLSLVRVISGVHFPKDVFWGAVLGIVCGLAALFISNM